jgi:hypothetical protein
MEVHLSPELQAKVERAAAENKSGAEEYVKQLVEHYVDHDASASRWHEAWSSWTEGSS